MIELMMLMRGRAADDLRLYGSWASACLPEALEADGCFPNGGALEP